MRLIGSIIFLFIINSHCFAQDVDVTDKYYGALSFINSDPLKCDSILNELAPDLKSFKKPDYFVFSVMFRGICHMNAKNYYTALNYFFEALEKNRLVDNGCNDYLSSSIYFGLTDVFFSLGYFELSEYYLSYCSDYMGDGGKTAFALGLSKSNQGFLSYLVGDYYNAIQYFDLALAVFDNEDYSPHHFEWMSARSVCYAHLERFDIANRDIKKVKTEIQDKFPQNSSLYSYVLSDEIEIILMSNDTARVKQLLDSMHKLNISPHLKLNYYLAYINYFKISSQIDSVNTYVDLAINQALKNLSYNNYKIAETFLVSSQTKYYNLNYSDALAHILEAEEILTDKKDIVPNQASYSSFNARLLLKVLLHKAVIQCKSKLNADFVITTNAIVELLDVFIDQRLGLPESKYFFLQKLKPQFEQLINDCVDLKDNELAFTISQKLHGNLLALEIVKSNASNNYDLPAGYIEYENQLKIGINKREIQLSQSELGSIAFDSLSKGLLHSRVELKKLIKSIENTNPGYYVLKYASPEVKSVSTIQSELLDKQSALIEYFIGEQQLYTFVITSNDFQVIKKGIGDDFSDHVKFQFDHLRTLLDSSVDFDQYIESTEYLHRILLDDVFNVLSPKVKHLYMIPDGLISYIPFGTLFEECPIEANDSRYDLLPYLARKYNFYYHYSSALLESGKDALSPEFSGLAPNFKDYNQSYGLDDLAYSMEEVELISAIASGKAKLDTAANLSNIKKSLKQEGILHLATHAESNDTLPLSSRIFLQDGPLHAYEIYNSQNKLDLAVLSACKTGDGVVRDGEGIMSLARSFLSSGCETIITSLWSVNDRNSISLMQSFYEYLYKGDSIGNSLAKAKRKYLYNANSALQAHPFNWATFIAIGNPNQRFYKFPWVRLGFGLSLLCLLILLWKRNKTTNSVLN